MVRTRGAVGVQDGALPSSGGGAPQGLTDGVGLVWVFQEEMGECCVCVCMCVFIRVRACWEVWGVFQAGRGAVFLEVQCEQGCMLPTGD